MRDRFYSAFAAFVLFGVPAVAQTSGSMAAMPMQQNPADQAMIAGMTKMNDAMKTAPVTGDADRDFVTMMIPHHQAAVNMAKAELRYGKDPTLRGMAWNIIAAQNKEIVEMKAWQAKH